MADKPPEPPARLYKYRDTGKFTETVFNDRTLFFASPSAFNDPFDCGFQVLVTGAKNETVTEAMAWTTVQEKRPDLAPHEQIGAAKEVASKLIATRREEFEGIIIAKLSRDTNERVGICCFTEVNDDILMWSHYADYHRGICLEFSPARSLLAAARPVEYGERYPSLDLLSVVVNEDLRATAPWMLKKAKHWSYEKEWRVLDFEGGPGAKPLPPSCLTGVIMGCRISARNRARVRRWVSDWPSEVTIYQAMQSRKSFRLEIEEVP